MTIPVTLGKGPSLIILFVHSSVDGHLDDFHNLAVVYVTSINTEVCISPRDNVDAPQGRMLTKISHTKKGKYCVISITCGILKKKKKKEQENKLTGTEKRLMVARGGDGEMREMHEED